MKIPVTWWNTTDNAATVVLTQYHIKPSAQGKFPGLLSEYIVSSLRTTGNTMAEAYYEKGDPCILWTIERWSNRAAYRNNRKSNAAKAVTVLAKTGLAAPVQITFLKDLEMLTKEVSPDALTVMLLVNAKAGTEAHFRAINHDLLSTFRNEAGVQVFQLSQVIGHKTKFIVYKKFRDWDAFQYHLKHPALAPIIKFLQTSIKETPFEKGYHQLIQFAPPF